MILIILLGLFCLVFFYYALHKPHQYWKDQGAFQETPSSLFGSIAGVIFQKISMSDLFFRIYRKYEGKRYVPYYQFLTPVVMIRDPELIKQIAVKEFNTFPERTNFVTREVDPLWSKSLFSLPGGQEWKDIRNTLSPAFTASKLKGMFGLITTCAQQFVDYFETLELEQITVEMKDAFTRATNDIIATVAFGVSCNSMVNGDNEFFRMGTGVNKGNALRNLKFFVVAINPKLIKYIKIRFIGEEFTEFFRRIIKQTMDLREKNNIVRHDMIHLLMEARKGKLRHEETGEDLNSGFAAAQESNLGGEDARQRKAELTDDVITSQAVNFYLAGFDTTARAMCFTAYELALNTEIQQRLRDEVDQVLEACGGKVTYEALLGMKYMDMVVSESLRKWPPFATTERKAIKSFTIEPKYPHEHPLRIDKDVLCQFPIFAIHRDPKFYPDPMKFDPERFSDENRHNIKSFTYIPFGAGPRNCIGSRFALLEVKTIIFYILSKFEMVPVQKTPVPFVLSKKNVSPDSDEGFWLGLKRREIISD